MTDPFATLGQPLKHRPGDSKPASPRRAPRVTPVKTRNHYAQRANPWNLTAAQFAALAMVIEGLTYAQIGAALQLSERTVEAHIYRSRFKMGVANNVRAAVLLDRWERDEQAKKVRAA